MNHSFRDLTSSIKISKFKSMSNYLSKLEADGIVKRGREFPIFIRPPELEAAEVGGL